MIDKICAINWTDREEREAYFLGTIGLVKGLVEVFAVPFVKENKENLELVGAFMGGVVLASTITGLAFNKSE